MDELCHGNLRPYERGFHTDTDFTITMDAFSTQERWFRENLNGQTAKHFISLPRQEGNRW